jgi:ribosomal protein S14
VAIDYRPRQTAVVAQTAPPATLDDLVRGALEQHRSSLATLVRERVTALVDELVEFELNGHGNGLAAPERPDSKRCARCGEIKPANAYEKHRSVCRQCRRDAARESKQRHRQEPEPEEAHSPPAT